ncbi:MAG: Holliday junction branch migration protein RuvA [Gammaproteobacteria bacterium]|nr:Holliday junction branch migration protein RuvA [Gammaproteobacteria bacterium]MDP6095283.1 Holliday junction branch migration protein RuvA [Gammaproteobacteria bacterium]MDP7454949.1 Holliday junction branch migration protein RuvA [Gammaproteobacteria bacterium]
MIGRIRGKLLEKKAPDILLDVGGIAYELQVPMSTLYQLPDIGIELLLHTHFVVREDAQLLYGFYDPKEKTLFRALIKVNGVGPKMALAILSGMEVEEFIRTVRANDIAAMVNMPGVGKKTAERLIVEMRDRLGELGEGERTTSDASKPAPSQISKDAETALISLGYKPQIAASAIAKVIKENIAIEDSETLIRLALKGMA